jgi:TonB family protein
MSPPRATYSPDPEYSPDARGLKYQGTVVISLIADASGAARDLQIQRPLGLGLDEKAVAAVSTWKFEPAQKNGNPISIVLNIEVNFHL